MEISILTMLELPPFFDTLLKWGLIITILVIGFYLYGRTRTFKKGTSGKKLSFGNRTKPYFAEIHLVKSRRFNPSYIEMTVTNTGKNDIDLNAPVIIFKRWFTKRRFRVLKVEHSEIYPIFLEPGRSSVLDISMDQFYEAVPELQLACRMRIEMIDHKGKSYRSQTIRLKWF